MTLSTTVCPTTLGAPIAQWVKRWPTDLAVQSSIPARGRIFSTVNGVPLHTAFHYQPLIVLILLKYCRKGHKIGIHPSIHLPYPLKFAGREALTDHTKCIQIISSSPS